MRIEIPLILSVFAAASCASPRPSSVVAHDDEVAAKRAALAEVEIVKAESEAALARLEPQLTELRAQDARNCAFRWRHGDAAVPEGK